MTPKLKVTNLIEKARNLVHDGRIEMAESGEIVVQEFTSKDGSKYELKLVITLIDKK